MEPLDKGTLNEILDSISEMVFESHFLVLMNHFQPVDEAAEQFIGSQLQKYFLSFSISMQGSEFYLSFMEIIQSDFVVSYSENNNGKTYYLWDKNEVLEEELENVYKLTTDDYLYIKNKLLIYTDDFV